MGRRSARPGAGNSNGGGRGATPAPAEPAATVAGAARLRLRLAPAVREGDELALRRVLKRAARVAPARDAQAELAELTAARRRRRRNQPPGWRDWLTRIAHPRRTRP
jgi:hypothetical protein